MKTSDIRGGVDTSVVVRLLAGRPESLRRAAFNLSGRENPGSVRPGFIDRLIHLEDNAARSPLITFEESVSRLKEVEVLQAVGPDAE